MSGRRKEREEREGRRTDGVGDDAVVVCVDALVGKSAEVFDEGMTAATGEESQQREAKGQGREQNNTPRIHRPRRLSQLLR
jgi:hypothetical protein